MTLKAGIIAPHPPILIPQIGGEYFDAVKTTADALSRASTFLDDVGIDALIVTSPHSALFSDKFVIRFDDALNADFEQFGAVEPKYTYANDVPMAETMAAAAQRAGVPLYGWEAPDGGIDWGVSVPCSYLGACLITPDVSENSEGESSGKARGRRVPVGTRRSRNAARRPSSGFAAGAEYSDRLLETRPKTPEAGQNWRTRPKAPDAIGVPARRTLSCGVRRQTKPEVRERMCDYVTEPRARKTQQTGFSAAFLGKNRQVMSVSISGLPYEAHYRLGQTLAEALAVTKKRFAFVASGDLSHMLTPDAPNGFSPRGAEFDRLIQEMIADGRLADLKDIDPELIKSAGECGLRSFIIMAGALAKLKVETEVLSYEGPFGVGYLVATMLVKNGEMDV